MTDPDVGGRGRALVTGTGAVTPLGTGVENFWDAALHGKSGIGEITLFDPSPYPSRIAGECRDFDPTDFIKKKQARRMDRFAQLGIAAGIQAAESAGIVDLIRERPERVAIVMGSGIGGLSTWEREYRVMNERGPGRVSPFLITMMVPNMAAGQLAIVLGATGPEPVSCSRLRHGRGGDRGGSGADPARRRRRGYSRLLGSPDNAPLHGRLLRDKGREPSQRRPRPAPAVPSTRAATAS